MQAFIIKILIGKYYKYEYLRYLRRILVCHTEIFTKQLLRQIALQPQDSAFRRHGRWEDMHFYKVEQRYIII